MQIRDPESFWPLIRDRKIQILDLGPGINISDPQHCSKLKCSHLKVLVRIPIRILLSSSAILENAKENKKIFH
jgi:hypothetical protein